MRKTKAELERDIESLAETVGRQADTIERMKEDAQCAKGAAELLFGPSNKEPETEVGYLRRELAYAQGQLHQSHLAVKQLCGRIQMTREGLATPHGQAARSEPVPLNDSDRHAIHALSAQVRELMAALINQQDLGPIFGKSRPFIGKPTKEED